MRRHVRVFHLTLSRLCADHENRAMWRTRWKLSRSSMRRIPPRFIPPPHGDPMRRLGGSLRPSTLATFRYVLVSRGLTHGYMISDVLCPIRSIVEVSPSFGRRILLRRTLNLRSRVSLSVKGACGGTRSLTDDFALALLSSHSS